MEAGTAVATGGGKSCGWICGRAGAGRGGATPTAGALTVRCSGAAGATGADTFGDNSEVIGGVGTADSVAGAGASGGANSCATLIWLPKDITRYSQREGSRPRRSRNGTV